MIPSQSQLILPLLTAIQEEGGSAPARTVCDAVADKLNLSSDEREADTVTAVGKRYNVFDRSVRWANQLAKLRGLTQSEERGTWTLTAQAQDKLENASPGVVVVVYENDLGVVLWAEAEAMEAALDDKSIDLIVTSPPYNLTRSKEYEYRRSEEQHVRWLTARAEAWSRLLSDYGSVMINSRCLVARSAHAQPVAGALTAESCGPARLSSVRETALAQSEQVAYPRRVGDDSPRSRNPGSRKYLVVI